jgi:hypothetical protein
MSPVAKRVIPITAAIIMLAAASAGAQPRRFFYDPFWRPWYPYAYAYPIGVQADIRTAVTPKDTEVYVDGYYAGRAADFDGVFKRLHVTPGGHAVTFHLDGFRTVTQDVYVRPDSTFKMSEKMERLPAGEASTPVPAPRARADVRRPVRTSGGLSD